MSDIINLNLSELVSNIKDKKISSNEVTNAYIERSIKSKHLNSYNEETFDDALKCQFVYAYPILESYGIKGVFFVPTIIPIFNSISNIFWRNSIIKNIWSHW